MEFLSVVIYEHYYFFESASVHRKAPDHRYFLLENCTLQRMVNERSPVPIASEDVTQLRDRSILNCRVRLGINRLDKLLILFPPGFVPLTIKISVNLGGHRTSAFISAFIKNTPPREGCAQEFLSSS